MHKILVTEQRVFQLSIVKPKPNQLHTNKISQPISHHSKIKTKTIAQLLSTLNQFQTPSQHHGLMHVKA